MFIYLVIPYWPRSTSIMTEDLRIFTDKTSAEDRSFQLQNEDIQSHIIEIRIGNGVPHSSQVL